MKRSIYLFSSLTLIALMTGCMGYKLGGSQPEGIETVFVAPIINKTDEPAIEIQLTHALRERIQFDGRLELKNTEESADAVIEIMLYDYRLMAVAFQKDLKTTAQQYRLRITGTATLLDSKTGEVISRSTTYGEATFPFDSDLTTAKRNALPRAAEEMAKFMVDDLIERW